MSLLKRFALAASYVTCLPLIKLKLDEEPDYILAGLSKYLPAVGILIGALLFGFFQLLQWMHANAFLQAFLLTSAWLALTGGLHFDGLMDTADGIFSHRSRERMIEIMSDSRVGNYGAITGFLFVIAKLAALFALPSNVIPLALFIVPTWGRWCETYAIGAFEYVKPIGKGKIWHDSTVYPKDLLLSAVAPVVLTVICLTIDARASATLAAATISSGLLLSHWLKAKLGGHTGDTYGAVVEFSEAAALIVASLASPIGG